MSNSEDRKNFSYYVELTTATGEIKHTSSSVQGTNEKDVEILVRRVAARKNMTVNLIHVWEEVDNNIKLSMLSQYYRELELKGSDDGQDDLLYNNSPSKDAKETAKPKYPVPITPVEPPKKGFASLPCFAKMEPAVSKIKCNDRREIYDSVYDTHVSSK